MTPHLDDATSAAAALSCLHCAEWAGLTDVQAAALVFFAAVLGRWLGQYVPRWPRPPGPPSPPGSSGV